MYQTTTTSFATKITAAFEHHQAGNLSAAGELYRSVLSGDRDNLNALHLLGLLRHQQGSTEEAVALLKQAAAVLEQSGEVLAGHAAIYNNLGNALRAAGQRENARNAYSRGIELDPNSVELHSNLGGMLRDDGNWPLAIASYRTALNLAPADAGALINLACILIERGLADDALRVCQQLVAVAPKDSNAQFLLGRALAQAGDNGGAVLAWQQCLKHDPQHVGALYWLGATLAKTEMRQLAVRFLERAVALRPDYASAYAELGNVLQELGDTERAFACFRRLSELRPVTTWRATKRPADFSVLAINSPGVANTPPDFLFANAAYDSHFFGLLSGIEPDLDLLREQGDIVVNLISDADQGRNILATAVIVIDRLGKPVVNHPFKIMQTNRETMGEKLSNIDSCHVPPTVRLPLAALMSTTLTEAVERRGLSFPLLLRAAGSHGGEMFEMLHNLQDADKFVSNVATDAIYVTRFVDYRSADSYYRKYRFVLTDEEILPYHLAIGDHWKVHHHTTNMQQYVWMQDEEKAFLQDPDRFFSPAHYAAMAEIRRKIGLDFFGIDCSLDSDGKLLVFEVNASILIHNDNAEFPYKTPACVRIKQAFDALLRRTVMKNPVQNA